MEILAGMLLMLLIEAMIWVGVRAWRQANPPPTAPARSPGQQANRAAAEAYYLLHPRVRSIRVRRRTSRGPIRRAARTIEDDVS